MPLRICIQATTKDPVQRSQGKAKDRFDIIFSFIPWAWSSRNYRQSWQTNIRPTKLRLVLPSQLEKSRLLVFTWKRRILKCKKKRKTKRMRMNMWKRTLYENSNMTTTILHAWPTRWFWIKSDLCTGRGKIHLKRWR